jgi:ABC-2 type transport system permease protein
MPIIMLIQERGGAGPGSGFVAFAGTFLGLVPMMGLTLIQYSQQWQASDLFRVAPIAGPGPLCHGARRAVLCLLTTPVLLLYGAIAWAVGSGTSHLALLLPGIIALPIFALLPNLGGKAVPLSMPIEESKSAGRGLTMIGVMIVSGLLSALAAWAWSGGWFRWLLLVELVVVSALYVGLRAALSAARWPAME